MELETENGTVYDESSAAKELNDFLSKILKQLGKDDNSSDSVFDDSKLKKIISSRLSPTTSFVISEIKPQQVADMKIIEKHVANSLYELQSAFRSGHSTETALIRITDGILFIMGNDEVTGLVFVDFRKAFDVINHNLLLKKLIYGASLDSVAWF